MLAPNATTVYFCFFGSEKSRRKNIIDSYVRALGRKGNIKDEDMHAAGDARITISTP
jgi:hypothetical protein